MTYATTRIARSIPSGLTIALAILSISCGDEADDPSYWGSGTGGTGADGGAAGTAGSGGSVGGSAGTAGGGGSGGNVGGSGGNVGGSSGSGETGGSGGASQPLGSPVAGQYHLGPVEWSGSFWNSCAPYPDSMQSAEGSLLAGLGINYNGEGQLCDACIRVDTAAGKSAVLRVVTTGQTNEPGDIDVSSAAYDLLNSDEYPRTMTWTLVPCPDTGNIHYQFQTEAHAWWSSFWVRNPRLPIETVEVRSTNHADWFALRRGPDGTWNDDGGFGEGAFTLRVTATTGAVVEDSLDGFVGGDLLVSPTGQFP